MHAAPAAFPELPQLLLLALLLQLPHWGPDSGQGFLPRTAKDGAWDSVAIAAGMACLLRQFPIEMTVVRAKPQCSAREAEGRSCMVNSC